MQFTKMDAHKRKAMAASQDDVPEQGPMSQLIDKCFGSIARFPPQPDTKTNRPSSSQSVISSVYRRVEDKKAQIGTNFSGRRGTIEPQIPKNKR